MTGPSNAVESVGSSRGRLGRLGRAFLWYVLPGLVLVAVGAYVGGAVALHADPPAVPVEGQSMHPTLQTGDLVILEGVDPATLKKGDIIALHVPGNARSEYKLPADIVHRIIKVEHIDGGLVFQTKGDANPGPDVFTTPASDVVGKMVARLPGLGYPFLFFRSRQGEIFLGAAVLVLVVYFLLGLFEDRRAQAEASAAVVQDLLRESAALKEVISKAKGESAARAHDVAPLLLGTGTSSGVEGLGRLAEEVAKTGERARGTQETMHQLVAAVGEYGEHLMSHTAVLRGLAATTAELQQAASNLNSALGRQPVPTVPTERRSSTEPDDVAPADGHSASAGASPGRAVPPEQGPVTLAERGGQPATEVLRLGRPECQAAPPRLQETFPVPDVTGSAKSPTTSTKDPTMTIDPARLRQPTLKRSFRGYSRDSVERLLMQAADTLAQAEKERDELREHLRSAEGEIAHYRQVEASLNQALIAADKHAKDLKEHSVLAKLRELIEEQVSEREQLLTGAHEVRAELEELLVALKVLHRRSYDGHHELGVYDEGP